MGKINKIPNKWTQEEINEYFNIRLNTLEKFMPTHILNFEEIVCDEDVIDASSLKPEIKAEMKANLKAVGARIKKREK